MDTKAPDIDALTRIARDAAQAVGLDVSPAAARRQVQRILFDGNELWGCLLDGLITEQEARNRFLAVVESWIRAEFDLGWDTKVDWVSPEVEASVDAAMRRR